MVTSDLPLFPLSTVLVPSMTLPLHIFEDRYRLMIRTCLRDDKRFGVVLLRTGSPAGEAAGPCTIGTVAEITAVSRLDDGRMFLITEGRERFRIIEWLYDRPYLHGMVEYLDEAVGLRENAGPLAGKTRVLATRYVRLLLKLAEQQEVEVDFPTDPLELSYTIACLLRVHQPEVQQLLEASNAEERLRHEVLLLRREFCILDHMAHMPSPEQPPYCNLN